MENKGRKSRMESSSEKDLKNAKKSASENKKSTSDTKKSNSTATVKNMKSISSEKKEEKNVIKEESLFNEEGSVGTATKLKTKTEVKFEEDKKIDVEENDNEDIEEVDEEVKERKSKKKKKGGLLKRIVMTLIVLSLMGIAVLSFLLYGPWNGFRDWYITSAMTTMTHQWLATIFYSQDVIDEVMARNNVEEIDGITDTTLIKFQEEPKKEEKVTYANEYERQVLEREPGTVYKKIDISGKGYDGYLAFVYDPSKIHTMVTSQINVRGEYVTDMAKREGAVLAINGGGFDDPNYSSNGGTPTAVTIVRGKTVSSKGNFGGVGGVVGFTKDNILTLGRFSASKAEELGIRDAVTTGCPFLIINGESTKVNGNGGWGDAARTVIGQRQDGIVLMLVINGRNYAKGIIGTDMKELIDIMERYGAYNAACLDGGTSTVMVENGEIINDPIDGAGRHKTRWIPTAFGVFNE